MVSYECSVPAQEARKLHAPQDRGEKTFGVITQPLTGTGIVFLKLNILSLVEKELS